MADPPDSASSRIAYLDGWRGLAIIVVLIGHFVPGMGKAGGFGVELFFVLSGRLMADILFVRRTPLPEFLKRRFSRVYPALFVLVACLVVLSVIRIFLPRLPDGASVAGALTALTFTLNYARAFGLAMNPPLGHVWSLCVEEQCYLLLIGIALVTRRRHRTVIALCLLLGMLAMLNGARLVASGGGDVHEIYWRTDVRLAPVFLSVAANLVVRRFTIVPAWLAPASGLAATLLFFAPVPLFIAYSASAAGLAVAVNTLDAAWKPTRDTLALRPLVYVGIVSYSLYLWQQPFFTAGGGPIRLAAAVIFALASYHGIEVPARGWINGKRWRGWFDRSVTAELKQG